MTPMEYRTWYWASRTDCLEWYSSLSEQGALFIVNISTGGMMVVRQIEAIGETGNLSYIVTGLDLRAAWALTIRADFNEYMIMCTEPGHDIPGIEGFQAEYGEYDANIGLAMNEITINTGDSLMTYPVPCRADVLPWFVITKQPLIDREIEYQKILAADASEYTPTISPLQRLLHDNDIPNPIQQELASNSTGLSDRDMSMEEFRSLRCSTTRH